MQRMESNCRCGVRRQADIGPQMSGQSGRQTRTVPPGSDCGAEHGEQAALMDGIGDGEFEAQNDAALG